MSKLPFGVTLSIWLVLFLTAWNGLRLWTAIAWQKTLFEFSTNPGPVYVAVSGTIWLIVGLTLSWGLLLGKAWAGKILVAAAAGYSVWYWSERLVWQVPRSNWPFAVAVNLILLVFIFFTNKSLTRETYERKN
jgi:hypothetical protein